MICRVSYIHQMGGNMDGSATTRVFRRVQFYIFRGRGDPDAKLRRNIRSSCAVRSIQAIASYMNRCTSRVTGGESDADGPGFGKRDLDIGLLRDELGGITTGKDGSDLRCFW